MQKEKKYSYKHLKSELEHTHKALRNESLESFRDEINLGYFKLKAFNEQTDSPLNSYLISTTEENQKTREKNSILMSSSKF